MHIGLDIGAYGHKSGLGRYVHNLVNSLISIDRENKYTLFCNSLRGNTPDLSVFDNKHNVELCITRFPNIVFPYTVVKIKQKIFLPAILRKKGVDIFHAPTETPVFRKGMKTVLTIHDLTHLLWPQPSNKNYIKELTSTSKKVDVIITYSRNTKLDVMKLLNIEESKIRLIYPGVEEKFRPITDRFILDRVREKYGIDGDFILYNGRLDPRKNIVAILKAFHKLRFNDSSLRYKLVVTGDKKNIEYKNLFETIKKLGIQNDIIFTGYVAGEDLTLLLNAADLLVYPSFYEGFGFPPLEAMACGTPVIASNVSSVPEVVGDTGILIDPYSIDELVDAMNRVLKDLELRKTLGKKGIEKAKLFNWKKTAIEVLKVYKEIY